MWYCLWAIQTFLCGGSRLPFGSGIFSESTLASLAVVLGTYTCRHDYWHCVITPGLQVSWLGFVCMARSVLVSSVRKLGLRYVGGSVARGFIFLSVFLVCPTFAVMLLLFGAVCSFSLVLAQFGRTHVWTGQGHLVATLQYKRRAPSWIKLKPENLKKQIGKLAEKYDALIVNVTLRDDFGVPQVELVTGIKFLRILKKEGFAPSIPEVLYFLVKKAKSMRKHLDKNRKNKIRSSVSSSLRAAFTALRGTTDASSSCLPTGSTSLLRPRLVLVAPPFNDELFVFFGRSRQRMRSKRFCAEDRGFLSEGEGQFPFGNPLTAASDPFKDAEVFRVRVLYIDLPGKFRTFPFGNEGQFAFVNPFRRNGRLSQLCQVSRSCACLGRQDGHHEGHGPSPFVRVPVGLDPCGRKCRGARTAYYYDLLLPQNWQKNLKMKLHLCMVFPMNLDRDVVSAMPRQRSRVVPRIPGAGRSSVIV